MTKRLHSLIAGAGVVAALCAPLSFAETIKVAFIDPLSGPFAPVGQGLLRSFQMVAEVGNREKWAPGHTFEVTGFDNKASPQESLTVLKTAIDQGFRYVVQGNGSGAAGALIDAINKHNERNPGKEVVFLNYAAVDPDLTNSKCMARRIAIATGVPTVMGATGVDRVKYVGTWNVNNETYSGKDLIEAFKKKYNDDYYAVTTYSALQLLGKGVVQAKSTDPVKVAFAMEGQKFKTLNGDIEMRKSDHQLQQPLYVATWVKANNKDVKFDQENTGYGWRTDQKIDAFVASQPTSCAMKRPS